jgi:integrase
MNTYLKEVSKELASKTNNKIINMDDVKNKAEEFMKKEIKASVLANHKYRIWQGEGKDKRWKTHLPPNHRILSKSTKEALEDAIVAYYLDSDVSKKTTLKTLYPEWLKQKELDSAKTTSIRRIDNDWNKYYKEEDIINVPIIQMTTLQINSWLHHIIKKNRLNKKQFYNMQIIIKQMLRYAYRTKLITENPFEEVEINKRLFEATPRKSAEFEVFKTNEEPLIKAESYRNYEEGDALALAIPLLFQTGLRVGELVALKTSDVVDGYLYISRMERKISTLKEDGTFTKYQYEVVNRVKSLAGIRKILLSPEAMDLIEKIKQANKENGLYDEDYLFLNKNGRIHARAIDYRLRKYCKNIDIPEKSLHKIRKTFISALLETQLSVEYVSKTVGHEHTGTTYDYYCFNRDTEDEIKKKFYQALSGTKWNQKIS